MSGFSTTSADGVVFTSFPDGEPKFLFLQDSSSDGNESTIITPAALGWVREQFYDFLQDSRRKNGVDYIEAYIEVEGTVGLHRCELTAEGGKHPGDGPTLVVTEPGGSIVALYDI